MKPILTRIIATLALTLALVLGRAQTPAQAHHLVLRAKRHCALDTHPRLCFALKLESLRHPSLPDWSKDTALRAIVRHESTFDPCAVNPGHHGWCWYTGFASCGWFQFDPCRCFPSILAEAYCGESYILHRYGTPERAWSYWQAHSGY